MNTLQINKFSTLHGQDNIIFCKTDYLLQEFEFIKKLSHDIILISGNSDYVIDQDIYNKKPQNIKKWFAQNAMFQNEILTCLPIGIENLEHSYRPGHGVGYERVLEKEFLINNKSNDNPTKFIYANFNIKTNLEHRTQIKNICMECSFIDWEESNLSIRGFFEKISEYEAIVCAQGNGPGDNHRIYETLYMNRIPITFNKIMYENLHHLFPVVFLENYKDLYDYNLIKEKIEIAKNKKWDKSTISIEYWISKIKNNI